MNSDHAFSDMLRGLRDGSEGAVLRLVRDYEPYLRRTLRRRLAGSPLQAATDSADLCQSVLGTFLLRFAAGEFDVTSPADLTNLLLAIARRKFARLRRREGAGRRDRGRTVSLGSDPHLADERAEEPSVVLARSELVGRLQSLMAESERELFHLRRDGHSWEDIATRLGEPPVRLRKRFSRAVQAACQELRLEVGDD